MVNGCLRFAVTVYMMLGWLTIGQKSRKFCWI